MFLFLFFKKSPEIPIALISVLGSLPFFSFFLGSMLCRPISQGFQKEADRYPGSSPTS